MKALLALVCLCVASAVAAVPPTAGQWVGLATRAGDEKPVGIEFYLRDGTLFARYSIAALDLEDLPIGKVKFDPATGKLTAGHSFEGRLGSNRLTGKLRPMLLHGEPVEVALETATMAGQQGTLETDVSFQSRGFTLKGTLVRPAASGRHPALVSLHGSGPSTRWFALARARRFARAGYAMLIFDKPGSGESGGDWTMSSLDDMASDAIAAVDFLRAQPGIDPSKVGLWGHSQAGHIISRAIPKSDRIAFAIVLAGGGATPREVEEFGYINRLRRNGASPAVTQAAMAWVGSYLDYESSGRGYEAVVAELNSNPAVKEALGVSTVYPMPKQQPKWEWVANYDPLTDIANIKVPILLLFADKDEETPGERSLARWREGLAKAGNQNVQGRLFAGADHHFLVASPVGGWPSFAAGYHDLQIDWLDRLFGNPR